MAKEKVKKQQVLFEYLVDQQATQRVATANKSIEDGFVKMQEAVKRGGVVGVQELKRLEAESREALKDINALRQGAGRLDKSAEKAFDSQVDSIKDFQRQLKLAKGDVRDFDDEFSQASQRAALAGDVGSQARTLGGLGGRLGFRGADESLAVISEFPDSLEAIARLKPALRGLPDVLKSTVSAIGPFGIGAIGAAAAIALLAKRSAEARKAAKDLADQIQKQVEITIALRRTLESGDLEGAAQQIQTTTIALTDAGLATEEYEIRQQSLLDTYKESGGDLQQLGRNYGELKKKIEELDVEGLTETYDTQIGVLEDYGHTLEDVEEILAETTEAEKERIKTLLDSAEATRQNFLKERALLEQGTEQLNSRLEAIDNERQATQLAIREIENSGTATEEMTDKLNEYRDTLENLSQEQKFINDQALMTAQVREQQAESEERLTEAAEDRLKAQEEFNAEAEKALQERTALEEQHAADLVDISKKAVEESEKALETLNKKLADLGRGLATDLENQQIKNDRKQLEAQVKAQRAETDKFIEHRRNLLDIQEDADDQANDLEQARNFQGVFNLRKSTRKRIQDEQKDMGRRLSDQAKDRARNKSDLLKQFDDQRTDRLRKFQQDITDTNRQYAQERIAAQQNAINAIMIRRQQFAQEQQDLFQQSTNILGIRRQMMSAEIGIMQGAFGAAQNMLSQIQSQQAQVFNNSNVTAFGAGALGSGSSNTTNNNVNSNVSITPVPQQSAIEIALQAQGALKAIVI